jgi:NAD dependent epimerase/dehydratase
MDWKNRKVLVTGAGGFIGSHLTEALARRGAKVRALVRYNSRSHWGFLEELTPELAQRVDVWPGDVTDAHFVEELVAGQEIVFHLAALIAIPYSYVAPTIFTRVNVEGTLNVLQACRRHKTRKVVHTSTSEVYGTALYAPIDEKHPLQGQSPYSASKIGADHLAESFYRSFGLPVAIARPFNTFGPRQSARAVIPTIVSQLLQDPPILKLGSLLPVRDFNYVDDTVEGFLAVASTSKTDGQAVNLGSGRGITIAETAKKIMALMGRRATASLDRARVRPDNSEVFKLVCDNRKARRLLGWRPRRTFEEGLKATIGYVSAHRGQYNAHLYNV